MSVPCRARVAAATAALSVALALAMTGTTLAAGPADLPTPRAAVAGFAVGMPSGPVPTTPAMPVMTP
jgi:hypothetical protein